LHAEHLLVDHKKMSKSLGNFYTVRDLFQKGYSGRQLRYMLLQTHYRTQLNFSLEGLDAAGTSVQRIVDFAERLKEMQGVEDSNLALPIMKKCREGFAAALADDLNISVSLSCLFEMIREINSLCDHNKVGRKEALEILENLHQLDAVLGVLSLQEEEKIPNSLLETLEKRNQARMDKNWKLADEYRDQILDQGYKIEDSPKGARLKKIRKL
jgi:cysteinyl-tRNA synthetase